MPRFMRYRRRKSGFKLSAIESAIAREMHKANRLARASDELKRLKDQGFVDNAASSAIYNMYRGHDSDGNYVRWRPARVRGFGAYSVPGAIGRAVGAYATGGPMGLARDLTHEVARASQRTGSGHKPSIYDWVGSGAYGSANQLVGAPMASSLIHSRGDETNDVIISHREYLGDLTPTSASFQTLYSSIINPGLSNSFPWLSQLAQFFEEYEFIQLLYTVESMVTEGNTFAAGTLIMCTQYNPTNALFNSKSGMENYEHSQSFKVTEHAVHGVECDPQKRSGAVSEYVRTGPVPSGQDPKTYDMGIFQIASQGAYANLNIGELWVTYKIRLSKAKVPAPGSLVGLPIVVAQQGYVGASGGSIQNFLGLATAAGSYVNFGIDSSNPNNVDKAGFYAQWDGTNTTIFFPDAVDTGFYRITCNYTQTAGAMNGTPGFTITNGSAFNAGVGTAATSGTVGIFSVCIIPNAPGTGNRCSIKFTLLPWSSNAQTTWVITQLNTTTTVGF